MVRCRYKEKRRCYASQAKLHLGTKVQATGNADMKCRKSVRLVNGGKAVALVRSDDEPEA